MAFEEDENVDILENTYRPYRVINHELNLCFNK